MRRLKWLTSPLGLVVLVLGATTAIALLVDLISITSNQIQTGEYAEDALDLQLAALPGSGSCVDVEESDWEEGPLFVSGAFDQSVAELSTGPQVHIGTVFCLRRVDNVAVDMRLVTRVKDYSGTDTDCSIGEAEVDATCGSGQGQITDHYVWDFITNPVVTGQSCETPIDVPPAVLLSEGVTYGSRVLAPSSVIWVFCAAFVLGSDLDHDSALAVQSDGATWTWEIEGREEAAP